MRNSTRRSAPNARTLTLICLIALLAVAGYSWLPGLRHVLAEGLRPSLPSDTPPVVRAPDGDPTFGTNGRVVVTFDASSEANDVAIQTDGKIVLVGSYLNSARTAGGMALARLNTDGLLDQTFGNGGKVTTPPTGPVGGDRAQAVVIQPDGKILVAGDGQGNTSRAGVLRRFNVDGSPDLSFGSGGRVFTEFPTPGQTSLAGFNDVALLSDGGIAAVGEVLLATTQNSNIVVARFLPNGMLNASFGGLNGATPGTVVVDAGGFDSGNAIAEIRSGDNQILMAGTVRNFGPNPSQFQSGFVLINLNLADGRPNTSFGGGDGIETVLFGPGSDAEANAIAWLPGSTTASSDSGSNADANDRAPEENSDRSVVVGRLGLRYFGSFHRPNGSLDTDRAVNGVFSSSLSEGGIGARYWLPTGDPSRILSAGTITPDRTNPSNKDFSVLGLSFVNNVGIDFTYKFDFSNGSFDEARAIAVQTDANVVLAGVTEVEGELQIGVIRLGPPLPPLFFGSRNDNIIRRKDPVNGAVENFDTLPPSSAGRPVTVRQLAAEQTEDLTPGRLAITVTDGGDNYLYIKQPGEPSTEIAIVNDPLGLTISGGDLYYTECFTSMCTGSRQLRFRPGITGAARTIPTGELVPEVLAVSPFGDIIFSAVSPSGNGLYRLPKIDEMDGAPVFGDPVNVFNFTGTDRPTSITFERTGENVLVALNNGTVQQLIPVSGGQNYQLGPNSASGLGNIGQLTVTENGEVLVTEIGGSGNPGAIHRLDSDLTRIGSPLTGADIQNPTGIAATQTLPPFPDLSVNASVTGIVNAPPTVRYEIDVLNIGLIPAGNVQLEINFSPNFFPSSVDRPTGWTCATGTTIVCTISSLPPTVTAQTFGLNGFADGNGLYPIMVRVSDTPRSDRNQSNNTAEATAGIGVTPNLTVSDVTVTEGNTGQTIANVTVSQSAAVLERPLLNFATADGTATIADNDYSAASGQVRLNPLETRRTFQFLVNGDTIIEPDQHFLVNFTAVGANVTDGQAQVNVLNDDAASTPTVSINNVSVTEGNTDERPNAVFTVTLSAASQQIVSVNWDTEDGSARGISPGAQDFVPTAGILIFNPGETSKEISVPVLGETLFELDENFFVDLTGADGATIADSRGEAIIVNDDQQPAVTITARVSLPEGDSGTTDFVFTVTVSPASSQPVTVNFTTEDFDATAGQDYTPITSGQLTFNPGETSKEIRVAVNGDTTVESDETFLVTLTGATGAFIPSLGDFGVATILNDDLPPPTLSINDVGVGEGSLGSSVAVFTLTRSGDTSGVSTVNFATADGTATANLDYGSTSGTLTFNPGETSKTIEVPIIGDPTDEPDEIFVVNLTGATGATIADEQGVGTIFDNDDPLPTLAINDVGVGEGTLGSNAAVLTVTLSGPSTETVTVRYATAEKTGVANAATSNVDYLALGMPVSLLLTFNPGETSKTIEVPIISDTLDEPNEVFSVVLLSPAGANIVDGEGTVTIFDNDDPPPTLAINDVAVGEGTLGANVAVFTVTRSGDTSGVSTVNFATADGTAAANLDYGSTSGTLTFNAGETSKTVEVPILHDTLDEPNELFVVNLTGATGATIADEQGVGTIFDNDEPTGPSVQFGAGSYTVAENGGSAQVTVTRTGDRSSAITVDYAISDGTGSERSDYTTAVGTLRFAAGEGSKSFMVLLTDDRSVEPDETVILTLSNPTGGVALGSLNRATLTITSNDTTPPTSNPIEEPEFFVEQLYHDFLNRRADPAGKGFWMDQITSCGADTQCRELRIINVSAAFFLSIEFQQTGFVVYRAHQAAFDTGPSLSFRDFLRDTQEIGRGVVVGQAGWEQLLEANTQAFFTEFVNRPQFVTRYPLTLTAAQYVDALNANTGGSLSQAERDALVAGLTGTETRATVLRAVAEDSDFTAREFNRAFVYMQYLGYLRRRPNDPPDMNFDGFNFWLGKLNQFNGNFIDAEMVKAFNLSGEYRGRFGP